MLLECLAIMRQELELTSKRYNGLEPKEGMEEAWFQCRQKIEILQDMIHAYESEPVKRALADWQKDIIERNSEPEAKMDGELLAALDGLTPEQMEQLKRGEAEMPSLSEMGLEPMRKEIFDRLDAWLRSRGC